MHRRLGDLAQPYRHGRAAMLSTFATGATAAGALVVAVSKRQQRAVHMAGSLLLLSGAAAERFAVFYAGAASAQDPGYTVGPQRERLGRQEGTAPGAEGLRTSPARPGAR
jgi:hypothetical protein